MKLETTRLIRDIDKSFIIYHEIQPFSRWHRHSEYELVLITKGKGKRMVGDQIDRFERNDLVFIGSNLPHEWLCDNEFYDQNGCFLGEGIVYQFLKDFLGPTFFDIPENRNLKRILDESSRGLKFYGKTKDNIISIMVNNYLADSSDRLFSLFSIFRIMSKTREYTQLSSPGFMEPFHNEGNEPMQKAMDYLVQNFQSDIGMKEMLRITNMSNTAFCTAFRKAYRLTFKEFLLKTRIGYACKLLTDGTQNISQIAYSCGFENLSNFNRQFKKLKNLTPSQYQDKVESDKLTYV